MIELNLWLTVITIVVMFSAVLGHLVVAYYLAPRRAKEGLLHALTKDDEFQIALITTIVGNMMRIIPVKKEDGSIENMRAIDPLLKYALGGFEKYLQGKSGKMVQEMTLASKDALDMSMMDNPILAMAMSQIPKKYLPYVNILMQMLGNQQQG